MYAVVGQAIAMVSAHPDRLLGITRHGVRPGPGVPEELHGSGDPVNNR
jgi:hypothetical protein